MPHFLNLGKLNDFPLGKMRAFRIDDAEEVVVLRLASGLHAFDNECTHQGEYLTDGFIIGREVVCAYHDASYDLDTGVVTAGPAIEPLPIFPVRIEGDEVQIEWPVEVSRDAILEVDHSEEDRFGKFFIV